jgi:transcription elongation factor GreA
MNLSVLVRKSQWDELETAWTELALTGGGLAPALEAIATAAQRREVQRCLPLVREHAEALTAAGNPSDAAELVGQTMLMGGSPGELSKALFENARAAWGEEPFWELYVEISGLHESVSDVRAAWRRFRKLLAVEPGRVVYHAAGWGLGRIDTLDLEERQTRVSFASGRDDRFPLPTVIDIFEILEPDDLRCLVMNAPADLKKMLKEEPLDVLRWVLARNAGRAAQPAIKLAMGTLGVEGSGFTAWWKRARKAAEGSEWFEISGPPSRAVVRLLATAEDPVAGMRRQILRSRDLGEALTRVRALTTGAAPAEGVLEAALGALGELSVAPGATLPQRLGVWLFLRDQLGTTPEKLREVLLEASAEPVPADPSQPSALWQLFALVPGVREQERCIELIRDLLGETWLDEVERSLQHAPPGMVRGLVDALEAAGRREGMLQNYLSMLARPTRNPLLLVRLAERLEGSPEIDALAPPHQRLQCLLHLAVHLYDVTSANPALMRARMRLSQLLATGEPCLLERLMRAGGTETLRALATLIESGVDRAIERRFTKAAVEIDPDIYKGDARDFWDSDSIWTTRAGLKQRQEELRVLRDVKIPENAEAIGRAASYGDLSENSEWSAAIEDQRNLTQRAMELEAEIERARLIENAILPEDRVAPGTRVRYVEVASGKAHTIDVLGPWDADGETRVSYRSPLAAGMLGEGPGAEVDLTLPSGTLRVRVETIEPIV